MTKEEGFGLLEVVFALAVIGIALLPLVKLTVKNNYQVKEARRLTEAINLARWKLEVQRSKSFEQITGVASTKVKDSNYKYLVEVKAIAAKLKRVTVKIKRDEKLKAKLATIVQGGD